MQLRGIVGAFCALLLGFPGVAAPHTEAASAAVSYFEPAGKAAADWMRFDPSTRRNQRIARFPALASGLEAAWSADGKQAVVWSTSREPESVKLLRHAMAVPMWTVDQRTGTIHALPQPHFGQVERLDFDSSGHAIALTFEGIPEDKYPSPGAKQIFHLRGKAYEFAPRESSGVVFWHVFRLVGDRWELIETRPLDRGHYGDIHPYNLPVFARLARRSTMDVLSQPAFVGESREHDEVQDPALLRRLKPFEPFSSNVVDPGWYRVPGPGLPFYSFGFEVDSFHVTRTLVIDRAGRLQRAPGSERHWDPGLSYSVTAEWWGPYFLISEWEDGSRPRLYDRTTGSLLFASDTARKAVFWAERGWKWLDQKK